MTPRTYASLALCAIAAASFAQSVRLRLNLTPGKTYSYQSVTDMKQNANGMNMPMKIDQLMLLKVGAKKSNGFPVTHSVKNVKVTAPKDSPMAGMAKQIEQQAKQASFTSVYSDTGKVVSVGKVAGGTPGMQGANQFTAGFMGVEYPKNPVSVGSKWTANIDLSDALASTGMKVSGKPIVVTYKVLKIEKKNGKTLVTLATTIAGKSTGTAAGGGGQGAPNATMNLTINGTGTAVVDAATGLPVSSRMSAKNVIGFGGMNMTQSMTVTSTLK